MSSGKTHSIVNTVICTSGCIVALSFYPDHRSEILVVAFGVMISTIFLSPDLDLPGTFSQKAWGWFGWLWFPYHLIFRHRGLSHVPILGTLSRLIWLFCALFCFYMLLLTIWLYAGSDSALGASLNEAYAISSLRFTEALSLAKQHNHLLFLLLMGMSLADLFHLFLDSVRLPHFFRFK